MPSRVLFRMGERSTSDRAVGHVDDGNRWSLLHTRAPKENGFATLYIIGGVVVASLIGALWFAAQRIESLSVENGAFAQRDVEWQEKVSSLEEASRMQRQQIQRQQGRDAKHAADLRRRQRLWMAEFESLTKQSEDAQCASVRMLRLCDDDYHGLQRIYTQARDGHRTRPSPSPAPSSDPRSDPSVDKP